MSKKKGAGIAAIIIVAAIGGLAGYSAMLKQHEAGPAPVVTTINREDNKSDVGSTSIAENPQAQQQDNGSPIANNTVIANNTIIINKPVYRNNTIIYQPVTINLENYRTTINQNPELQNKAKTGSDKPVDKSHSMTIFANRIKSDGWSAKFTDDKAGMFTAVYDIKGNLIKTGYADEHGFTVKGLQNKLYFVYPSDCNNCGKSKDDIMFKQWEDGSKDRPRLVPADSEVTASYTLAVPEKPKLVPLIPPGQTQTADIPEIKLEAHDSTNVYGWVQVTAEVENKVQGYDQIVISVYAPNGTLHDSFSYSDQQGFFASREAGEDYKIVATYKYDSGTAQAEIMHSFNFAKPAFANLSAREDNGTVSFGGTLTGGLPRENITIAVNNPENETIKKYSISFATKPVFTLFMSSGEAASIFSETGNYTFVVTHMQTGVQGKTMLFHNATGATETSTAALNVSNSTGKSQRPEIAVQGSNVYLVWQLQDEASGQHEIMFAKSDDSGATFSKPVSLSEPQEAGFSLDPSIAVSGNNVYVVWANYNGQEQAAVAFRSSNDSGKTFGNTSILGNYTGENPHPHIELFKGDIYVSWITGANEEFTGNLIIAKSHEGTTFEAAIVSKDASNSSMASSADALYLAWRQYPSGDTTTGNSTNIFASSLDGTNFETSEELQGMTIFSVAASGNTSYVGGAGFKGEDVIVARSADGSTFNTTSVANGSFPEVAASQDNVYVIWTDDENKVSFAASTDTGKTFGERQNLSNEGFEPAVATGDGKVYTAWEEGSDIMFAIK